MERMMASMKAMGMGANMYSKDDLGAMMGGGGGDYDDDEDERMGDPYANMQDPYSNPPPSSFNDGGGKFEL